MSSLLDPIYGVLAAGFLGLLLLGWLRPLTWFRPCFWLFSKLCFSLRIKGRQHLPRQAAVFVCNQVRFLDWLLVWISLPRRTRLLVFAGWTRYWGVRSLLRWTHTIVLDGQSRAEDLAEAIAQARQALGKGESICLFLESQRNTQGLDVSFADLYHPIVAELDVPVVPMTVVQRWGSLFSPRGERIRFVWPVDFPHQTWALFGTPLPSTTTAGDMMQTVSVLGSDFAIQRSGDVRPAHRQFVRLACRHPLRACMTDSTRKGELLSYGKVLAGAMCLTKKLRPHLATDDKVGIWLPPGLGCAFANVAIAFLGKASVNLNYTTSPEGIRTAARLCGLRHVLTARRFLTRMPLDLEDEVEFIYLDELLPQISTFQKTWAFLQILLLPGFIVERWILALGKKSIDDVATVIFSSGSTGEPKGVVLTHRNLIANLEGSTQWTGLHAKDRVLGVLPFFHSFGYTVSLWLPLCIGASAVYHADPRQAKEIGELCRTHACTGLLNTATFLRFCMKKCVPEDFRTLSLLICGAEKLPVSLARDFKEKFGLLPLEGYGCTELSPVVATNLTDNTYEGCTTVYNFPGSVGLPIPGVSVRVIDPESRKTLPLGEEGLLVVRGPNVMQGYLHRPDLTARVLLDGDYITGDMARIGEDGTITLTGRLSRFAKIGGEMVPLERIEEELHLVLGSVERVLTVSAVPDDRRGERVIVLHLEVLSIKPSQLTRHLQDRGLPNLWVPDERDFFPIEQIPVLGTGKLDLRAVKEMATTITRTTVVTTS